MNKEIRNLIEEEIYPMIITPIEKYIKPRMTIAEKVVAKQNVFLQIKEIVNGAKIVTNLSVEEFIEIIRSIMQKRENLHEGATLQHELVTEILDEIHKQSEKEDKTI